MHGTTLASPYNRQRRQPYNGHQQEAPENAVTALLFVAFAFLSMHFVFSQVNNRDEFT